MPIQIRLWRANRAVRLAGWNKSDLICADIFIGARGASRSALKLAPACQEGQTERKRCESFGKGITITVRPITISRRNGEIGWCSKSAVKNILRGQSSVPSEV